MSPNHCIFLSYAKADAETAAVVSADLTAQGFQVWDYASSWKKEDLPFGIPETCRELIQRATWFIPIVSAASVNPSTGRYMVMEIEYAAEQCLMTQNRVVPLMLSAAKPKKWLKPFDILMPLGVIKIDPANRRDYLLKIARLCRQMNSMYRPVMKQRPYLPFWQGFLDEVTAVRKNFPESWHLMPLLTEFDRCFEEKEWPEALSHIAYFNAAVSYFAEKTMQTPHTLMVHATCAFQNGLVETAASLLDRAEKERPNDPAVAGLKVYLHLSREEPYLAREHLVTALARCTAKSLRERMYYLRLLPELGEPISEEDRKLAQETDVSTWEVNERRAVYALRAILLYQTARYKPVIDLLQKAAGDDLHGTTTVIQAHLAWLKLERNNEAETVLTDAIHESKSNKRLRQPELYYHLAEFYLKTERVGKTLTVYERHLCKPTIVTRRFAIRYARILKQLGDEKRTLTECRQVLGGEFPPPRSCADYYYDGFANYLLGNMERAKYDFERSRQFSVWYPRVEAPS